MHNYLKLTNQLEMCKMKNKITYKLVGPAPSEARMILLLENYFYTKIEIIKPN